MIHVDLTVPGSLLATLKLEPHEMGAELCLAAAIHWYQQAILSMERAAEAAGLARADFLRQLSRRQVDVFGVDDEHFRRELERL
jgi:predicted HTH domain antitoxin